MRSGASVVQTDLGQEWLPLEATAYGQLGQLGQLGQERPASRQRPIDPDRYAVGNEQNGKCLTIGDSR
jgi:hypothetical protein